MAEGKYGKYITTELVTDFAFSTGGERGKNFIGRGFKDGKRRSMEHMVWIDQRVIPGAFYCETVWFWPPETAQVIDPEQAKKSAGPSPHTHSFPELLSFCGTDMEHPEELYCDVEFWIDNEKYVFNKSFVVYIPENVKHCPLKMHNMTRPVFHYTMGPGQYYST
ncbi:MAG: hypothetical protein JXA46_05150 [Dehalococcoidales bacterium]|nr:hypothetical protein [Dehalococcoidales bacterium]